MIKLEHISAGYNGTIILKDVSLDFPQGSITVLLGPNGCGKSTLLKTALGLIPLKAGTIWYDETNMQTLTPREIAQKAAYLPQARAVPSITAGRMVLHGRFPYLGYPRRYSAADRKIVRQALQRTGSLELENCRMEELSGGQRQKVYLSMAIAQQAKTIFMDEPTTYLDVQHQLETMHIARELANNGTAVVMVLHDLGLALRFADRVAVFEQGNLIQLGTAERIFLSGVLDQVFQVQVRRVKTEQDWLYYCEGREEK